MTESHRREVRGTWSGKDHKQGLKFWLPKHFPQGYGSDTLLVFVTDSDSHILNPIANFIKEFVEDQIKKSSTVFQLISNSLINLNRQ